MAFKRDEFWNLQKLYFKTIENCVIVIQKISDKTKNQTAEN